MSFHRCVGVLVRSLQQQHLTSSGGMVTCMRRLSTTAARAKFLSCSPNTYLDKSVLNRYRQLKYDPSKIQATYLWIDGTGEHIRMKDRILNKRAESIEDLPGKSKTLESFYFVCFFKSCHINSILFIKFDHHHQHGSMMVVQRIKHWVVIRISHSCHAQSIAIHSKWVKMM